MASYYRHVRLHYVISRMCTVALEDGAGLSINRAQLVRLRAATLCKHTCTSVARQYNLVLGKAR